MAERHPRRPASRHGEGGSTTGVLAVATAPAAARAGSSEDEVRDVVRRVVDAVLDERSRGVLPPAPAPALAAPPVAPGSVRGAIAVGADHGGLRLKELIAHALAGEGWQVHDCGTTTADPVDYPDFAHAVARLVADGTCAAGIVVDGAGIGSCMAANKVPGIRAALCHDISTARNSREHNHANVLTLGGRLIGDGLALEVVKTWLETPWGGGRHEARVEKITDIERRYLRVPAGEEVR